MVLAAGVLLYIAAFIIYFDVSHMQMEDRFQAEREKFGVQGAVLTASGTAATPTPAAASAPAPTPAPDAPSTPGTNSAPTSPAAPESNSAPAPSSTLNEPRTNRLPFFQLAAYRPAADAIIQASGMVTGQTTNPAATPVATPPTTAPATGGAVSVLPFGNTNAVSPAPSTVAPAPSAPASSLTRPVTGDAGVIVLLYHQFKPAGVPIPAKYQWTLNEDVFEGEMKYIHDNGYHVVSLADLLRFLKHEITLPPGSVVITIDDGYKSAIVYAAPILKKYGYPWTFFIYPEFITTSESTGAASWNDLLELQKEGVDIESHSMTHPHLQRHKQQIKNVWHNLTPEEYDAWLTNETAGSKAVLEQRLGKPITAFAYPFGDYNPEVKAKVIAAGYKAILTVAGNPVHSTTDPLSIGRYTITQSEVKYFVADLRQGALGLSKADPEPGAVISDPRPVITAVLEPMSADRIDPRSITTSVYGFDVRHDFDPQTNTVRLYLQRDLIQQAVLVSIRVKDAVTGQVMVANWHFNYTPQANALNGTHQPIAPATNSSSPSSKSPVLHMPTTASAATNPPAAADPEPLEKTAVGTPLDTHPALPASPVPPTSTTPPSRD